MLSEFSTFGRAGGWLSGSVSLRKFRDSQDYYCPYEICWPNDRRISYAGGVDSVQALDLALKIVGVILYTSEYGKAGRLRWHEQRDLGFPVTDNCLDLVPKKSMRKSVKQTGRRSPSRKMATRG